MPEEKKYKLHPSATFAVGYYKQYQLLIANNDIVVLIVLRQTVKLKTVKLKTVKL